MIPIALYVLLIFSGDTLSTIYFHSPVACDEAKIVISRLPQVNYAHCFDLGDRQNG